MAVVIYSHDAQWSALREIAAASIADNYMKTGTAVGSDAVEAGGTNTILVATAHAVAAKDFLMFYDGGEESEPRHAESVSADLITLGDALSGAPSAGENFVYVSGTVDAAEALTTDTTVIATGHAAAVDDLFWMVDGAETAEPRVVAVANANDLQLNVALSAAPSAAEEFATLAVSSQGSVDAGTTDTIITAAAHGVLANDIFVMTAGGEVNEFRIVTSVATNTFTLNEALSGTPSATESYNSYTPEGVDAVEAGASDSRLIATAHSAAVGDEIIMTSGGEDGEAREVSVAGTDYIDLEAALSGAPSATETFNILRSARQNDRDGGKILIIKSTLDRDVYISMDGSSDHLLVEAGDDLILDLKQCGIHLARGDDNDGAKGYIYVKSDGTAPASGVLAITVIS